MHLLPPFSTPTLFSRLRHRAFTLLELIVVLVVLGLLAAIAIPTYANIIDEAGVTSQVERDKAIARRIVAGARLGDGSTDAQNVAAALLETNIAIAPGEYAVSVGDWDSVEDTGSQELDTTDPSSKYLWKVDSSMLYSATRYDADTVVYCHASITAGWANCQNFTASVAINTSDVQAASVPGPGESGTAGSGGSGTTTTTTEASGGGGGETPPSAGAITPVTDVFLSVVDSNSDGSVLLVTAYESFATADEDNYFDTYALITATGSYELISAGAPAGINSVDISRNGRYVVYAETPPPSGCEFFCFPAFNGTLHVYDRVTDTDISQTGAGTWTAAVSDNGVLAFINSSNQVAIRDATSGSATPVVYSDGSSAPYTTSIEASAPLDLQISADGTTVAWGTGDGTGPAKLARSSGSGVTVTDLGLSMAASTDLFLAANDTNNLNSYQYPTGMDSSKVGRYDAALDTNNNNLFSLGVRNGCQIRTTVLACIGTAPLDHITAHAIPSGTISSVWTNPGTTVAFSEEFYLPTLPEYTATLNTVSTDGSIVFYTLTRITDPEAYESSWGASGWTKTLYAAVL